MILEDAERMMICDVCGEPATCGVHVDIESIRMGYVGSWRCSEHHPNRTSGHTLEEWAAARADGKLHPDAPIVSHETSEAAE